MIAARRCPVCHQGIGQPTVRLNIRNHFDSIGRDECPGSGLEFEVAISGWRDERERQSAAEARMSQLRLERLERLVS